MKGGSTSKESKYDDPSYQREVRFEKVISERKYGDVMTRLEKEKYVMKTKTKDSTSYQAEFSFSYQAKYFQGGKTPTVKEIPPSQAEEDNAKLSTAAVEEGVKMNPSSDIVKELDHHIGSIGKAIMWDFLEFIWSRKGKRNP